MDGRRLMALFACFVLAFTVVLGRCAVVGANGSYAQAAQGQLVTSLALGSDRGNFYDAQGVPLTGQGKRYYALCIPGESSYARLFDAVSESAQDLLYTRRNSMQPFLVPLSSDMTGLGIYTYEVPERYLDVPIASHLLGYLNGDGEGVAGLELAYEDVLHRDAGSYVQCVTNAQGTLLEGQEPVLTTPEQTGLGVRLTLSEPVQRACEGIARSGMTQGCILVLECGTGRVLASVSLPDFDPGAVEKSIAADDTSLLNRALCTFNVGSVFKPVLAASALERNMDWFTHDCKGYVEVDGHVYRCAMGIHHGLVNLRGALEQSCNCYFVRLGQQLGGEAIWEMADRLGFGQTIYLSGGMKCAAGTLPGADVLENTGQLAGLSFGQGQLTAAPLQVAAFMDAIAAGGLWHTPFVVEGLVDEATGALSQPAEPAPAQQVLNAEDAAYLRDMLESVVSEGIGGDAATEAQTAAGKTGTAQTGQFTEEGEELLNFWFAGFWPADDPEVTVVVMQDGLAEAEISSAELFSRVCDALHYLELGGKDEPAQGAADEGAEKR
ncbi:MAG: penicillin-binding protein 2 [Oscillospiraceae bacterium]|nr:penicillin-binding protein 2 [Oscillospiraceae bacterium]